MIELDREIVRQGGLKAFIELAWHTVEKEGSYKSNWHIDAICDILEDVSAGRSRRDAIAIPPRHMKSVAVAVMWPAWDWIEHPERRFLFSSYAHNLSMRDSARCRRVIQSQWYQDRWGDRFTITSDQNTKVKFENNLGGYRLATSVKGQLTGEGGDIVVVDDPHNVKDAESPAVREGTLTWWDESMSSRHNDPATGAFVIIQQRVHENDLLGHILRKDNDLIKAGDSPEWRYLCLPARYEPDHPHAWPQDPRTEVGELLWPERVPQKAITSIENSQGPYAFAGQYQQRPAPREGGAFKRSWFPIVQVLPSDLEFARGWDLAATEAKITKSDPDWTATVKIGWSRSLKKWFIVDIARWREDPAKVEALILSKARHDDSSTRHEIPQDPGQAGKAQAKNLMVMLAGFDVRATPQSGDKVQRSNALAGQAGAGNVALWAGAGEVENFLTEITSFPSGSHDDMVDAAASAFNRLTGGTSGIMEFYARQADDQAIKRVEAAAKLKENGGNYSIDEYTENLGRALLNRPR